MYMKYFSFSITINLFCDGYKFLCRIIIFLAGTREFLFRKWIKISLFSVCVSVDLFLPQNCANVSIIYPTKDIYSIKDAQVCSTD